MAKQRVEFRCDECGATAPRWAGRCPACDEWNTMVESSVLSIARPIPAAFEFEPATPIGDVELGSVRAMPTGISELDRVLGGGLVPGSVTLIGGEPGVGKSTLLTQVAASMAFAGVDVLYVSAEESRAASAAASRTARRPGSEAVARVRDRARARARPARRVQPGLVVIDSIQTVHDPALGSAPGSAVQVRECAHRLVREAKQRDLAVVLVGHVTKEGGLAGPRVLEHVVDTVLCFEGDRHHALRLLRAAKHRFGSTAELGLFEMTDAGLEPVPDPSALFLADRRPGVAGSAVVPTLEGHRPLLVEVQALVAPDQPVGGAAIGAGRRRRPACVPARRARTSRRHCRSPARDVYALAVGGVRVVEPGADLALALAVASSLSDTPLPADLVACAEVGLGGELRQVGQTHAGWRRRRGSVSVAPWCRIRPRILRPACAPGAPEPSPKPSRSSVWPPRDA